ncbi:hypothetical protein NP233_g12920 [Leucocoprinus birnbaumii]|uniref:Cytochrome P450 n=1 Tax=Leucocoprinus birnbaumii TaxID=56174 RepID=A0AAD5VFK3_9AGAR|nr:hypothetical protein NP233_g12920 [Leucocoprinus birnbaumii]
MPTQKPWEVYDKWSEIYGNVIYFEVLGRSFLILGDYESAYDLFEKRSSNYSDRIRLPMMNEMMGFNWVFGLMRYGAWWRRNRRTFHDHFHPNAVPKYQSIQVSSARSFLRWLLKTPDDFVNHIRRTFTTSTVKMLYGMTLSERDDPYLENSETVIRSFSEAGNPGTFLVDLFPAMKYIPAWFPGAQWKRKAISWRQTIQIFLHEPWDAVKRRMREGTADPCVASTLIEKLTDDNSPENGEEEIGRSICGAAVIGGADTTVSTIHSLFMAMALYPEVQKSAQDELDMILNGRLPDFQDRPSLPYIEAMVKELLRWQLVTPLAMAHSASEADEYNGYYIPRGTVVIGNAWRILHDPEVYKDPLEFRPERFLKDGKIDPGVRDPMNAFGFGRRICPAVYDIRPGLDSNGKEIAIQPEMTSELLSHPKPFTCRIIPRSREAVELIRDSSLME